MIGAAIKEWPGRLCALQFFIPVVNRSPMRFVLLSLTTALLSAGCDRMIPTRHAQHLKDAESNAAAGDFARAISLYESALEDRPGDAEVHYKLALLYDDKMNEPLNH